MIEHLIHDTHFWVAVSTVLCFAFIFVKARKPVAEALDRRTDTIRIRLEEAESLYTEAQKLLAEYQAKYDEVQEEAADLIKAAEQRAQSLITQAQADIQKAISRQEASATLRIQRAERDVIEAIREATVQAALSRVQVQLDKNGIESAEIDASLDAVTKTFH
ncbi:MAG TPA: hypothetical protein VGF14_06490 [Alphaproteobacteria bacterium]